MCLHTATERLRATPLRVWVLVAWAVAVAGGNALLGQELVRETSSFSEGIAAQGLESTPRIQAGTGPRFRPTRFWGGTAALLAADAAAMLALNQLWYADYEQTSFHFHNDWANWKQQDKLGHVFNGMHLARGAGAFAIWSGMNRRSAAWYGGAVSLLFLSQIEVLDGFSAGWGASWPDFASNVAGAAAGGLQVAHPEYEAVTLKYSYGRSDFYDEDVAWAGNAIKDYEGISYWLVIRPAELSEPLEKWWPRWLGLSIGHGARGLEYALPTTAAPHEREIYLALDLDLFRAVDWPHPWMERIAGTLSMIRIPAPALLIHPNLKFYPVFR